jgi:hypothetical protein
MAQDDDIVDTFGVPEYFCEALGKIQQIGTCRRLVFVIQEGAVGARAIRAPVVKLVVTADVLANIAQMIVADIHAPPPLASMPINALAN